MLENRTFPELKNNDIINIGVDEYVFLYVNLSLLLLQNKSISRINLVQKVLQSNLGGVAYLILSCTIFVSH